MSDDYRKRKFFAAVLNGRHGEVARYISRGRANPAWKVGCGMSALDHAAYLGHVRIAELLLDNGWDLEARNDLGYCKELPCAYDPVPGGQGSDAGQTG